MSRLAAPAAALTLGEVAAATGGRVVSGPPGRPFAGVSIDSRTLSPGQLFVAIAGPRHDGHAFVAEAGVRGAAAALVHAEVAADGLPLVRVADTTRALADLARHARLASSAPVVAVTGSTGKTTTKEMAAALLAMRAPVLRTEANLNNRYGLPLTLLRLEPRHSAAVLELGMSQAGELRELAGIALPDVAAITNVAPVHLEFFESLEAIARAKAELLEGLRPDGVAVLNHDDPRVRAIGEGRRGRRLWFGRDRACFASAENVRGTIQGTRFDLRLAGRTLDVALSLPGLHFVSSFLAAAAIAHHLGIAPEAIAEAAAGLRPASHRGELRRLGEGVTLLDDSYNSNPAAVAAALAALSLSGPGRRVAFLGDMLELGAAAPDLHRETGARAGEALDAVYAVGPLSGALLDGARAAGRARELRAFPDSAAAAAAAGELVRPGDAVLVKGSRGTRMEAVVEALVARFGTAGG